jgi:prolyl-tRNA editing enzyme YbaK/EbsC (Cys-tRNA(Pro) deacylase)
MYKLIILIENMADPPTFDARWADFLHLAESMPGLLREATIQVNASIYGKADISMIHELFFETNETLEKAMASPQGQEAGQILQQITGGRMSLLVAEHLEDDMDNLRNYRTRTPQDLQAFMDQNNIAGEILFLDTPTPTVEAAAEAVGSKPEQIVKSVLFTVKGESVLTITSGTEPVEQRAIAKLYEVGRKQVKLAPPELVLQVTGYPVGTVPPFGHSQQLQTLLDHRVMQVPFVYAGGGAENALVRLSPLEIQRITQADIMDLHTKPE